jgi:hypothetical protein
MTDVDILLFVAYSLVLSVIFFVFRKKTADPLLRFYSKAGLITKIFAALTFFFFTWKSSDAYVFFQEAERLSGGIHQDFSNIKYLFLPASDYVNSSLAAAHNSEPLVESLLLVQERHFFMIRLDVILSHLSFGSYLVSCLLFSLIAYTGSWHFFRFFYQRYPHLHRQIAISFLFLPNYVLWTAGPGEDVVFIVAAGWLVFAADRLFVHKRQLFQSMAIITASLLIILLQSRELLPLAFLPSLFAFYFLKGNFLEGRNYTKLIIGLSLAVVILVTGLNIIADKYNNPTGTGFYSLENDQQSVATFIARSPAAITASLFRPYFWESGLKGKFTSGLESTMLLVLTILIFAMMIVEIFKTTSVAVIHRVAKDRTIWFCFGFSLIYAVFMGLTTVNFGSLVRFKIVMIPFFVMGLFLVIDKNRKDRLEL